MPDQYGNPTEAERRGQAPAGYAPNALASTSQPSMIFSGKVGDNTVTLYGDGPQLTYEQAIAYMRNQGQQQMANGSMTVPQWQALNPGASASDFAAYKKLNQTYKDSTSGQGIGTKIGNAVNFELDRAGNIVKGVVKNPGQILTGGIDPIGTKIGNAITGANNTPLVGQLGGATENDFQKYEQEHGFGSLGAARSGTATANYLAGIFGAIGAAHGIGQAINGLTGSGNATPMQTYHGGVNNLDQFSTTANPVGSFAGSQTGGAAGELANAGSIGGGAGVGGTGGALGAIASQIGGTGSATGGFGGGGIMAGGNLWGNLAQLGGSLYNTYQQEQGAKDAANASIKGDAAAIAEQRRQFDLERGDQMPWLQAGTAALGRLQDPTANFTASPGYAFTRAEGTRDLGNSFAARGGALSGNALRALDSYNTGLASNEYNNWWNQQSGLAGVGQTSAQSLGGLGQNSANNVSNLLGNQGNARASGIVDQTNARTGGINDLSTLIGNYLRQRQWGGG